jgi:hypothetical protein
MAFVVLISGVTSSILASTLQISNELNARSICNFTIDTNTNISCGQEVIITDNAIRIFGGNIDSIKKTSIFAGSPLVRNQVSCTDYNQYADRLRVAKTYEDKTAFYIFNDIVENYLTIEGVTTNTMQIGPTLKKVVFNRKTINECFNYLKDATQINWNINYYKQLNTFFRDENISTPLTNFDMLEIDVEETREQYRNRQFIRAGQDETNPIIGELPSPKPDGNTKTFILRYPIAKKPIILINSTTVSNTDIGINGLETGKKWYYNKNERIIVQDNAETTLSISDILTVNYTGLVKIIVQAENSVGQTERAAIELNTGIYEEIEDIASIDNRTSALEYANGLLQKYANITQILNIRTRKFYEAGQIINISNLNLNINSNYLIQNVQISNNQGYMFYDLKCLSGESLGSWVDFFKKLKKDSIDFTINEDEVLIILQTFSESIFANGNINIKNFNVLYTSDTLYPSDVQYPGILINEVTLYD